MPKEWILNLYTECDAVLTTDDGKTYDYKVQDPDDLWSIVWEALRKDCKITIMSSIG